MKRKTILMLLVALSMGGSARALSLDECRRLARENYPLIRQYGLVEQTSRYTVSNAAKSWLPTVGVQAGAGVFTDLLKTDGAMEAMGLDTKNHVLGGVVSIRQNVYDGGGTVAAKAAARAEAEVETRRTDVNLHDVRERVEQLFFGVLTLDEQLRQNTLLEEDLKVSLATVESLQKNGLANRSDCDAVRVELAGTEQTAATLTASRAAYMRMLGVFIGRDLGDSTHLERPSLPLPAARSEWGTTRSEMQLYAALDRRLDAERRRLDARLRPTVGFVGVGALHTTVTDRMHDGFLAAGLSLSWNIGALYTRKNDLGKLRLQREGNDVSRRTFLFNNRLQNEETEGTIRALRARLEKDKEILSLRESIRRTDEKKVRLGTETVNELVRSVNAVSRARLEQSLHELQLLQAVCSSRTLNDL